MFHHPAFCFSNGSSDAASSISSNGKTHLQQALSLCQSYPRDRVFAEPSRTDTSYSNHSSPGDLSCSSRAAESYNNPSGTTYDGNRGGSADLSNTVIPASRNNPGSSPVSTWASGTMALIQEEGRAAIRRKIDEAIEILPFESKQSYLEAKSRAPEVCEREADVFKFLRRCDFNIWEAAERICLYWRERKTLFGERFILPLTLTGDGALTREDILSLKAGYPAVLPETTDGRKIVYIDRRQILPNSTPESRFRCIYYLSHVALEDERTQTVGVYVFLLLATPQWRDIEFEYFARGWLIGAHALPIRFTLHLFNFPSLKTRRYATQDFVSKAITAILESGISSIQIKVHFEREHGELLDACLDLGMMRSGVPVDLGGTWTFTKSAEWCRRRTAREQLEQRLSWPERQQCNTPGTSTLIRTKNHNVDPDEKKRKEREVNVINSRRKRERRKMELQNLKDERDELLGERDALQAENDRLINLLFQTQQVVAHFDGK